MTPREHALFEVSDQPDSTVARQLGQAILAVLRCQQALSQTRYD